MPRGKERKTSEHRTSNLRAEERNEQFRHFWIISRVCKQRSLGFLPFFRLNRKRNNWWRVCSPECKALNRRWYEPWGIRRSTWPRTKAPLISTATHRRLLCNLNLCPQALMWIPCCCLWWQWWYFRRSNWRRSCYVDDIGRSLMLSFIWYSIYQEYSWLKRNKSENYWHDMKMVFIFNLKGDQLFQSESIRNSSLFRINWACQKG